MHSFHPVYLLTTYNDKTMLEVGILIRRLSCVLLQSTVTHSLTDDSEPTMKNCDSTVNATIKKCKSKKVVLVK